MKWKIAIFMVVIVYCLTPDRQQVQADWATSSVSIPNGIVGTTVGGAMPAGSNIIATKPASLVSAGAGQMALAIIR
jgi:hypothetical protein